MTFDTRSRTGASDCYCAFNIPWNLPQFTIPLLLSHLILVTLPSRYHPQSQQALKFILLLPPRVTLSLEIWFWVSSISTSVPLYPHLPSRKVFQYVSGILLSYWLHKFFVFPVTRTFS